MTIGEHWYLFRGDKAFWLRVMTEEEYEVLERFGFDRGTQMNKGQMELSYEEIQMELDLRALTCPRVPITLSKPYLLLLYYY